MFKKFEIIVLAGSNSSEKSIFNLENRGNYYDY